MFLRTQQTPSGTYLLLVENTREGTHVRQQILHRFGRLDELQASGQLEGLLTSLGRFATKALVLSAHTRGTALTSETRLAQRDWQLEWADVVRDLDRVQETRLQVNDETAYVVRSPATGVAGKVFQACGVALPPVVRPC